MELLIKVKYTSNGFKKNNTNNNNKEKNIHEKPIDHYRFIQNLKQVLQLIMLFKLIIMSSR